MGYINDLASLNSVSEIMLAMEKKRENSFVAKESDKELAKKQMIVIGKPINGISINGLEYLLNNDGSEMTFESVDKAKKFLLKHGFSKEFLNHVTFEER